MPSPKPTPTALKKLRGNPGKRSLPKDEPKPKAARPTVPPHVKADKVAYAEWKRTVEELYRVRVTTQLDRAVLARYVMAWSAVCEAESALTEEGRVLELSGRDGIYYKLNPWVNVLEKAHRQLVNAATELGMSPSSRAKVSTVAPEKENDAFAVFDGGKR